MAVGIAAAGCTMIAIQFSALLLQPQKAHQEGANKPSPSGGMRRREFVLGLSGMAIGLVSAGATTVTAKEQIAGGRSAKKSQLGDSFNRAVEQLSSDERQVRVNAIAELDRLVSEDLERRAQLVRQLVAFLQKRARRSGEPRRSGYSVDELKVRREGDLQDALNVLARWARPEDQPLSLRHLDLSGARFPSKLKWPGVDLTGTLLVHAELSEADLRGAKLGCIPGQNCGASSGAWLIDSDLSGADLRGAWVGDAQFTSATLSRANMSGLSLQGANLSGAALDETVMNGADLREMNLAGVDFSKINLNGVKLRGARAGHDTKWPANFDWRDAGVSPS